MQPLVTVIIPTYKREPEMIAKSINSVLNQSYDNIELIIIDDSPKDYSFRIKVKDYIENLNKKQIRYIQHKTNLGANAARNTGIKNANGKFIAFLDDDDEWEFNKLELQIKEFTNERIGLVYCKARVINTTDETVRPMINIIRKGNYFKELLKQNFIGSNSFVVIRSDVIRTVGMYDENLTSNQDYDLFIRISQQYEISGVNKTLVNYYVHGNERISTDSKKQLQGRLELTKKYSNIVNEDEELKIIWKIKLVPLYFKIGQKRKAIKNLMNIFIDNPLYVTKYLIKTLEYRGRLRNSILKYDGVENEIY